MSKKPVYNTPTKKAAEIIGRSEACLRSWRCRGVGPSYQTRRGNVYYSLKEVTGYVYQERRRGRPPHNAILMKDA